MDEVNVDSVDRSLKLVECVQAPFLSPPVVLVSPILNETPEICQVRAVVPPGVRKLVREAPLCEPPFQIRQCSIGNLDLEGDDLLASRNRSKLWAALCACDPGCRENGHQNDRR